MQDREISMEHIRIRILREIKDRVCQNSKISDMNMISIHFDDERRLEIIIEKYILFRGT